jgi:dsDNA-specific endonuclease/ATPase MutS2
MSNFFGNNHEQPIYFIRQTANKMGLPPQAIEKDNTMIYGDSLAFDKLIQRIVELQERFRNYMNIKK